jgi:hypothetical protein
MVLPEWSSTGEQSFTEVVHQKEGLLVDERSEAGTVGYGQMLDKAGFGRIARSGGLQGKPGDH